MKQQIWNKGEISTQKLKAPMKKQKSCKIKKMNAESRKLMQN